MLIEKADVNGKSGVRRKIGNVIRCSCNGDEAGYPCPVGSGGKMGFSAEPGGTAFGN